MLTSNPLSKGGITRPCRAVRRAVVVRAEFSSGPGRVGEFSAQAPVPNPGESIAKWLGTPFDLLAFGPRSTAGALLSIPERLSTFQTDMEKLAELLQDPRPLGEKQEVILKEAEARLVDCLEKGADVEADVLSNVKMVLPAEAANMLTSFIPEQPPKRAPSSSSMGGSGMGMQGVDEVYNAPYVTYSGSDVKDEQLVSEVTEIKTANSELNTILDQVRGNTDVAMTNVLLLSLKDARDQLQRRLDEVSPASLMDVSVSAAVREASILLDEINASFF